jgi:hypothetical protein
LLNEFDQNSLGVISTDVPQRSGDVPPVGICIRPKQ